MHGGAEDSSPDRGGILMATTQSLKDLTGEQVTQAGNLLIFNSSRPVASFSVCQDSCRANTLFNNTLFDVNFIVTASKLEASPKSANVLCRT